MSDYLFFITPIGSRDSKERIRFTKVLDLILRPAMRGSNLTLLTALDFELQTTITNAIVESVQGARLCVADISGSNPNVMFELGMRRQTGLPYLTIIEEGLTPPFDTSVEKYLAYNLNVIETLVDAQNEIARAIHRATTEPRDQIQSKPTLEGIVRQLASIELKLSSVASAPRPAQHLSAPDSNLSPFTPPKEQVARYIAAGNPRAGINALLHWFEQFGPKREMGAPLGVLGQTGDPSLLPVLTALETFIEDSDDEFLIGVTAAINGLARGLGSSFDFEPLATRVSISAERAEIRKSRIYGMLCNQIAMMWWTLENVDAAMKWGTESISADPSEAAYYYNLSFPVFKLGDVQKAIELCKKAIDLGGKDPDPSHLDRLVDMFADSGNLAEARNYNELLRSHEPTMALANDRARGFIR